MTTRQTFDTTDVLRLEVEVAPTGLTNLIANPDGKLGAWGWITPVSGSYMEGVATGLRFTAPTVSTAASFSTEPMPIAAGQYAAAAWDLVAITGYVRVRFEWLNSSYTSLSYSTQGGYLNTIGPAAYAPQLAPASTAFVRLRFDHYSNTSGANPTGNAQVTITNVKAAKAASASLGSQRINLLDDPSFQGAGWSYADPTIGDVSLAPSTAQAYAGTQSLRAIYDGTARTYNAFYATAPVVAGRDYVWQYRVRSAALSRTSSILIEWVDVNDARISLAQMAGPNTTTTGWTVIAMLATAPTGAVAARVYGGVRGTTTPGEVHYFDAAMVTEGTDVPAYFDGSTTAAGTKTYSWYGTPHASQSLLADTTLGSLVPTIWRNVLGPTHEIKIEREDLNLGTLTAELVDAILDPSQTTNLRPGRRTRLLALVNGAWEPLFSGKTARLDVTYDEKATPPKLPRISLVGVDPIQSLAAARRPEGVSRIVDLPYVLEGAGVPWKVNGSGNQVATATVVSTNDNATAVDQVAVTRDSRLGIAYVNRSGVLVANDYVPSTTFPNGDFAVNTTGWTGLFSATLARVTTPVDVAPGALRITSAAGGASGATSAAGLSGVPIIGGATYRVTAKFRAATTGRNIDPLVRWYNAAGTFIFGQGKSGIVDTSTGYTTWTETFVAPPAAAFLAVDMTINGSANGEIHYMDSASVALLTTTHTLDESTYSDLDVSFSSEQCINSVSVTYLAYDVATGETEEIAYGPYEDTTSINEWGRCAVEFTVHGIGEANVPAFAASVLARNAQPVVQVNTVSIPIKETSGLSRALIDLTDQAAVTHAAKAINQTLRVNKITHRISPTKWMLDLGFTATKSVASPQQTPPVQSGGSDGWTTYTPTITGGASAGNGVFAGQYCSRDGLIDFYTTFTLGSTSTVSGPNIAISLPAPPQSALAYVALSAQITDTGTTDYIGLCVLSGSSVQVWNYTTSGAYAGFATIAASAPMTWAAGDVIQVRGSYRPAP